MVRPAASATAASVPASFFKRRSMRSLLLVREAGPVAARALAQNYGSRLERR
jgi:hypothetical protein